MIDKFKACLAAKEFTQIEGVDDEEAFSPVVRITSICLVLALVVPLELELFQMNRKTAFLMVTLRKRSIWINPLVLYQKDKVCCLKRSIYGLK